MIWNAEQLRRSNGRVSATGHCVRRTEVLFDYTRRAVCWATSSSVDGPLRASSGSISVDLDVRYVDGRMELHGFAIPVPGVVVSLSASTVGGLAGSWPRSVWRGQGRLPGLGWAYGGASGFFTNYAMTGPQSSFSPEQCAKIGSAWQDRVSRCVAPSTSPTDHE